MTDEEMTDIALRFDGDLYVERELNGDRTPLDTVLQTGKLSDDENINRATCYSLQRFLYKWGGEQLPDDAPERRVFRMLCEHLKDEPEVREYRVNWR